MTVEGFRQFIEKGLSTVSEPSPIVRKAYYDKVRTMVRDRAASTSKSFDIETALDIAIAAHEVDNFPPSEPEFRSPSAEPQSASMWVWTQILAGCAAIGTIADVLKPVVNLQGGIALGALVSAIALGAVLRLNPPRRGMLHILRLAAVAVAATMAGIFGVQVFFDDGAPNGVLAEGIPAVVQLQDALNGIRASTEQTAINTAATAANTEATAKNTAETAAGTSQMVENTSALAQTTSQVAENTGAVATNTGDTSTSLKRLLEMAEGSGYSSKYLVERGYTTDLDGLVLAFKRDDVGAVMQFVMVLKPKVTADDVRTVVEQIDPNAGAISYLPGWFQTFPISVQDELIADAAPLVAAVDNKPQKAWRKVFCGGGNDGYAAWVKRMTAVDNCSTEYDWLQTAMTRYMYITGKSPRLAQ